MQDSTPPDTVVDLALTLQRAIQHLAAAYPSGELPAAVAARAVSMSTRGVEADTCGNTMPAHYDVVGMLEQVIHAARPLLDDLPPECARARLAAQLLRPGDEGRA